MIVLTQSALPIAIGIIRLICVNPRSIFFQLLCLAFGYSFVCVVILT